MLFFILRAVQSLCSMPALDAQSGTVNWTYSTASGIDTLAVANGIVYVSTTSDLLALDARTGALSWRYPLGNSWSPAVADGGLYVTWGRELYVFAP